MRALTTEQMGDKNWQFLANNRCCISETIEAVMEWNIRKNSHMIYRTMLFAMTLHDLYVFLLLLKY